MRSQRITLVVCALAMACSSGGNSSENRGSKAGKSTTVIGIDPVIYQCENLVTVADIAAILGGDVSVAEVAFTPPPGTAEPCHYLRTYQDTQQPWSFDMDCRDDALRTARALFDQYRVSKTDAGVAAQNVEVGKEALDHHGQALLFIDDDTPCYVRVQGPSAEGRLGLAKLLAEKLVPRNAPMRPRPQN